MRDNDGGPAFPSVLTGPVELCGIKAEADQKIEIIGMSLRDYFAARALSGLVNYSPEPEEHKSIAELCYALADAMLEAREQP